MSEKGWSPKAHSKNSDLGTCMRKSVGRRMSASITRSFRELPDAGLAPTALQLEDPSLKPQIFPHRHPPPSSLALLLEEAAQAGVVEGLSGPISRNIARLSLRYPISGDTFSRRIAAPQNGAIPPLLLASHMHICAILHLATYVIIVR